jgi:Fe-Mn family superoxide dismutase
MRNTTRYEPRDFSPLFKLPGFSRDLMADHISLYGGYVERTNQILAAVDGQEDPATLALRRRLGWEFNGMRLHELFFDGLSVRPMPMTEAGGGMAMAHKTFGGPEQWENDLRAIASIRGIGWTATVRDRVTGNVANIWINEHAEGLPVDCDILVLIDCFEHAYVRDYGTDRGAYLDALLPCLDWRVVEDRLDRVVGAPAIGGQRTEAPLAA